MGTDNPSDGSFQGNNDPGQIGKDPKTVTPAQVQPGEQTKATSNRPSSRLIS